MPKEEPTFHEFASAWFEGQKLEGGRRGKGLSAKGAIDLEWRLRKHLLPAFAKFKLWEITAPPRLGAGSILPSSSPRARTGAARRRETGFRRTSREMSASRRRRLLTV